MRVDNIKKIERKSAPRITREKYKRLDMAERVSNFDNQLFNNFISLLEQEDFICYTDKNLEIKLINKLAAQLNCEETFISLDCGSDSVIKNIFHAFVDEGEEFLINSPSFPMYKIYGEALGIKPIPIDVNNISKEDLGKWKELITNKTKLCLITNPNSPYGGVVDLDQILIFIKYCEEKNILVVIDEAYVDFGGFSLINYVNKFKNLSIVRTFSKGWGAAGIRLGYIVTNPLLKNTYEKVKLTFPISNVSLKFGIFLLDNFKEIQRYVSESIKERDLLISLFKKRGYEALSSNNNSIHVRGPNGNNNELIKLFNDNKIGYKTGSTASTPLTVPGLGEANWVRISIGEKLTKQTYFKNFFKF